MYGSVPSYRAMLDRAGLDAAIDTMMIGSAEQVAEQIGRLADAGVSDLAAVEVAITPDDRAATRAVLKQFVST
jgi:alkanesulfonate monooxygenase SsuD/methylene tetrahydromethanopterin reductase-like flavin-dependent oxidoreductase (luciferase family)